ncbi:FG-GAP-like repeat-containing protein [Myxococcota bacterium]|nr:FG-GAP-like repeat-containing protein [Myxococcota bacterium]
MRRAAWAPLLALAACGWPITQDELSQRLDADEDGHVGVAHGGEDCDDTDEAIHPDAAELCNGQDDDCDDDIDEDAVDASLYVPDADGDGWAVPAEPVEACSAPTGMVLHQPGAAVDCDDGDEAVYPGAEELCNGEDDDCDDDIDEDLTGTWYADGDGDGWGDPDSAEESCPPDGGWVEQAGDCDDGDETVHPEATEICADEVDQDCDEVDLACTVVGLDAHGAAGLGASEGARYGQALDSRGGHLVVGAPGDQAAAVAALLLEPASGGLDASSADLQVLGVSGSGAGATVALSDDLLGAGVLTLAVGAPTHSGQGAVALFAAEPGAPVAFEDAPALLAPSKTSWSLGTTLLAGGDLTGDGQPDLLVGDPGYGDGSTGAAWVVAGPLADWSSIDEHDRMLGAETGSAAGRGLAAVGDLDGDGDGDIVVGAPQQGSFHGQAYVVRGPLAGHLDLVDADAIISTPESYSMLGAPVAGGDIDGDGHSDLLVGAIGLDRSSFETGKVGLTFLFTGLDAALPTGVDAATGRLEQEEEYDSTDPQDLGLALSATRDLDGDARNDIVLSYPLRGEADHGLGTTYLVFGGVEGVLSLSRAQVRLVGDGPEDEAGRAVALDDLGGDGVLDLLIGAPGAAPTAGRVFRVPADAW